MIIQPLFCWSGEGGKQTKNIHTGSNLFFKPLEIHILVFKVLIWWMKIDFQRCPFELQPTNTANLTRFDNLEMMVGWTQKVTISNRFSLLSFTYIRDGKANIFLNIYSKLSNQVFVAWRVTFLCLFLLHCWYKSSGLR